MLTPAANAALSPALSIMQSIVADQANADQSDQKDQTGLVPNVKVKPAYDTQTTQKLNEIYFGDHRSVSQIQARIFSHLVQYVGKQIDAVEAQKAGKPVQDAPEASQQFIDDLKGMDDDVRSGLRSTINDFSEGKRTIQQTATKLFMTLDLDVLSKDTKITQYIEDLVGIKLNGMNPTDILKSFVNPYGKENEKLRSIISNELAGEEGSKTMQRLDHASSGIRSVEETKQDIKDVKSYDEVDSETREDDKKDLKMAKAYHALKETHDAIESSRDEDAELAKAKAEIEAAKDKIKTIGEPKNGDADGAIEPKPSAADGKDKTAAAYKPWGYSEPDDDAEDETRVTSSLYV